jgi:hypothetical protein
MSFLPEPYPDELFYSILSRYCRHSGNYYLKHTLLDIYNSVNRRSNPILQLDIDNVIDRMKITNIDAESLIQNHTLLPFFATFISSQRYDTAIDSLRQGNSQGIYCSLGINSSSIILNRTLYHCSDCIKEDSKKYGETYWHRIHQVPGVFYCPVHFTRLLYLEENVEQLKQKDYINPNELRFESAAKDTSGDEPELLHIAKEIEYMLTHQKEISDISHNCYPYSHLYKEVLYRNGMASKNGRIKQSLLLDDFSQKYSQGLLETLRFNNASISSYESVKWVMDLIRRENRAHHPLKHILLIRYLFGSFEGLIEFHLKFKSELSERKTIDNQKSEKSLLPNKINLTEEKRVEFLSLIRNNEGASITELRALNTGLYIWLYRNDKDWFRSYCKENITPKIRKQKVRVDWDKRDSNLLIEVKNIINSWELYESKKGRLIRITRLSIAPFLIRPYILFKKSDLLPRTMNFINNISETEGQFRIRRIYSTVSKLKSNNETLSKWRVLRAAGVRKEYLSDEIDTVLNKLLN